MQQSSQASWYDTTRARRREKRNRLADVVPLAAQIENRIHLQKKGRHPDFYTVNHDCEGEWRYYWLTQEHKLYYLPHAPTQQLQRIAANGGYGSPGKAAIAKSILRVRGF